MKASMKTLLVMAAALSLSACYGGLSKETKAALAAIEKQGDDSVAIKNTLVSHTGQSWLLVKMFANQSKHAVYYNPGDNKYYAFDTSKYVVGMTYEQLMATQYYSGLNKSTRQYQSYEVISETNRSESRSGSSCPISSSCSERTDYFGNKTYEWTETVTDKEYGYVTKTETIYTEPASGLVFEVGASSTKDLESMSAAIEVAQVETVRDSLVSNFGLSEDRAQEIANITSSWQSMAQSRALTEKDLVEFQSHVIGTDMSTLMKAAKKSAEGDSKEFNKLVKQAADLNGVSPEQAKKIIGLISN